MNLKHISDKQLLKDTKSLVAQERKISTQLLHHLKEIEKRKLFSEIGYPSLFKYLVQELGFSEAAAMRRIDGSRLLKDIPEIQEKLENGSLNLSHLSKATDKFKQENITDNAFKKEVLSAIENTSARGCDRVLEEIVLPNTLPILPPPKLYPVTVNLSEDNFKLFEDVRDLFAHYKFNKNDLFGKIFKCTIEHMENKRFKTKSKAAEKDSKTRYVPAGLKRAIFERDKVCQKCGGKHALQIDHIKPYALGGRTTKSNLRLLCRNCNQRARISSNLHLP